MKHNIRINGEVKEIDCELGSGILDKNGREIFEGDIVISEFTKHRFNVMYDRGDFWLVNLYDHYGSHKMLYIDCASQYEIVDD